MTVEKMTQAHAEAVYAMMQTFYASPAVHTNGSAEIFHRDIAQCIGDSPYLEGFVFTEGKGLGGYAMIAKSFSTEYGRPCIWIEDLYLLPACRGKGYAGQFFAHLEQAYPDSVLRLEVEEENTPALRAYRKNGFDTMPYLEMKKLL